MADPYSRMRLHALSEEHQAEAESLAAKWLASFCDSGAIDYCVVGTGAGSGRSRVYVALPLAVMK